MGFPVAGAVFSGMDETFFEESRRCGIPGIYDSRSCKAMVVRRARDESVKYGRQMHLPPFQRVSCQLPD
jgi:hypothetical protein